MRFHVASVLVILGVLLTSSAVADDASTLAEGAKIVTSFIEQRSILGKTSGIGYELGPIVNAIVDPAAANSSAANSTVTDPRAGFYATLSAIIFNKNRSILEAQGSLASATDAANDFYWGGFRVWSTKPVFKDGSFQIDAGFPTISMRTPIVGVPIGPITLRVDAGVNAEADVNLKLTPLLSIPIQFTALSGSLQPKVSASAFLEGYAKWLILRGGIGGELELIRTTAKVSGQVGFDGFPPSVLFSGFMSLLAGKVYAFVDYWSPFGWSWQHAIRPVLANWKGKCIDFTPSSTLPGEDPCAVTP